MKRRVGMMMEATQAVFELVLARPVVGAGGEDAALVHLWWRAPGQGERLVQVYVDDELLDVSLEPGQREMWCVVDRSRGHRVELLAVPAEEAWRARPELLRSWEPAVRDVLEVAVVRDETLLIDTQVRVSVDGRVMDQGPMWPTDAHRSGFGALFGEGGFGYDAATGPGLGGGELGAGPMGADGTAWRWRRDDLAAGRYAVELAGYDESGQPVSAAVAMGDGVVERLAVPAVGLGVDADFTLRWG